MSSFPTLSAPFDKLLAVISFIRSPRGSVLLKSSTFVLALMLTFRYWTKSTPGSTFITDLEKVGHRIDRRDECDVDEYDVIIVGGGTAGCVLASRLSEDPSIRVLLIEAGKSSAQLSVAQVPAAGSELFRTKNDYNLYTEPQVHAGGRVRYWPRAKLLGGCTTMNAMMFHYGAPTDYDEWAQLQKGQEGASSWSYKEFLQYFEKFERYTPSAKFPMIDTSLRGSTGMVDTGNFGYFSKVSAAFVKACEAVGIPRSHDVNTHNGTLGVAKALTYINSKGRRVTTETAYLTAEVLARPNLKVATKARVMRILFDTHDDAGLERSRAAGVEFANSQGVFRARARKEVVVSAGAVHTPQILMLSGVGPTSHLSSHGIPVVADLPGVGAHLMDHLAVNLFFRDASGGSLNFFRPQTAWQSLKFAKAVLQYTLTGSGPLTTNVGEVFAFVRSDDQNIFPPNDFAPEDAPADKTSGQNAPDIEFFAAPVTWLDHGLTKFHDAGDYISIHPILLRPTSTGSITLKSADPSDPPVIDPNYLASPNDVKVLVRGIRLACRIARTEPYASFVDPSGDAVPWLHHKVDALSDEEIAKLVREKVETLYHPACTARMAPLEDGGVVDPYLRVHGIANLRIADASVFPTIVSGHTAAPVIAIAEKAADLIKAAIKA